MDHSRSSPLSSSAPSSFVAPWLKIDPTRWMAGWLTGALGASCGIAGSMALAAYHGVEAEFPPRLLATLLLGPEATTFQHPSSLWVGFGVAKVIGGFWGLVYGHFVWAEKISASLGMGLTWGLFAWIFNWNLFLQSFSSIAAAEVSPAAGLLSCLIYGLSFLAFPSILKIIRTLLKSQK